jgi:hypothetical protein
MAEDQYRSLAADYHWFFNDVDPFLGCDMPGVRAAMAGLVLGSDKTPGPDASRLASELARCSEGGLEEHDHRTEQDSGATQEEAR